MKRNNTKRTLVLSLIGILLCFTMLIGSTFAWFTDTASTAVNKIQSGTLDIVLEYQDGEAWKNAEGKALAWNRNCTNGTGLWEPGCTYSLPAIRVRNNGNLSLKYKICINGIQGDAKLNEAIDWTINMGNETFNFEEFEGVLYPANPSPSMPENGAFQSEEITISGHMREDAGNEYQNLSIDGIGITVYATQYNWECDSYGRTYDEAADYEIHVADVASLQEALAKNNAVPIVLDNDIQGVGPGTGPQDGNALFNINNPQIIDLNGHTITVTHDANKANNIAFKVSGLSASLTIKDTQGSGGIEVTGSTLRNYAIYVTDNAFVKIEGGNFHNKGASKFCELIYVGRGDRSTYTSNDQHPRVEIYGGYFSSDDTDPLAQSVNQPYGKRILSIYNEGSGPYINNGQIEIYGGSFEDYDINLSDDWPAYNPSGSWCAEGYHGNELTENEHHIWTAVPNDAA